jgi:hypothetical protein
MDVGSLYEFGAAINMRSAGPEQAIGRTPREE